MEAAYYKDEWGALQWQRGIFFLRCSFFFFLGRVIFYCCSLMIGPLSPHHSPLPCHTPTPHSVLPRTASVAHMDGQTRAPPWHFQSLPLKEHHLLWPVWLHGLGVIPQSERSRVPFPLRAHAWMAARSPVWACSRGSPSINVSLSPFLPPFPSL